MPHGPPTVAIAAIRSMFKELERGVTGSLSTSEHLTHSYIGQRVQNLYLELDWNSMTNSGLNMLEYYAYSPGRQLGRAVQLLHAISTVGDVVASAWSYLAHRLLPADGQHV